MLGGGGASKRSGRPIWSASPSLLVRGGSRGRWSSKGKYTSKRRTASILCKRWRFEDGKTPFGLQALIGNGLKPLIRKEAIYVEEKPIGNGTRYVSCTNQRGAIATKTDVVKIADVDRTAGGGQTLLAPIGALDLGDRSPLLPRRSMCEAVSSDGNGVLPRYLTTENLAMVDCGKRVRWV